VLLREPLAALIGVPEVPWAAAAVPPTGALWMLLSLQRGALQGLGAYGAVGASIVLEAVGRLTCALVLYAAGLGVTGALLGTPLAVLIVAAALEVALRRRLGAPPGGAVPVRSLRSLARQGWLPIAGLLLLAVLQNVDVIVAKHELPADVAGSYAAAAMAAKSIVWVGMGIALFVLPEAARRAAARLDPRPVLLRALAILVAAAVPAVAVFAAAPELIVRLAFGDDLTSAASALPLLGGAMAMLAVAYLAVQLSIAVDAKRFLWVLAAGAVAEVLLLQAGNLGPVSFAAIVLGVQCTVAAGVLAPALRAGRG
jgi:O-antigen/teichoic acid export membrane protein